MRHETPRKYTKPTYEKRPKGRPMAIWKDDAENDMRKMAIIIWRQVMQDRDG